MSSTTITSAPHNGSLKEAIQIDGDSNLHFVCFPEGFKPPMRPQSSTDDSDEGHDSEIYCGTDEYVYQHFFADFGPLHLGHVWAFCKKLGILIRQQGQGHEGGGAGRGQNKRRPVYVYSSDHPHRRSNAAVLVLAYAVSSAPQRYRAVAQRLNDLNKTGSVQRLVVYCRVSLLGSFSLPSLHLRNLLDLCHWLSQGAVSSI